MSNRVCEGVYLVELVEGEEVVAWEGWVEVEEEGEGL